MKNALIAAIVAALVFALAGVKGAAAAGPSMGSLSLPSPATPASLMTGTAFSVNTSPVIDATSWQGDLAGGEGMFYLPHCIDNTCLDQSRSNQWIPPTASCTWDSNYNDYDCTPGPLEAYTIACWQLSVDVVGFNPSWKCGVYHSNPINVTTQTTCTTTSTSTTCTTDWVSTPDESGVQAQTISGLLGTTGYQQCSWIGPYDPSEGVCSSPTDGSAYGPGNASPAEAGNLMPNLDAYVGQTVTFDVNENWCSFLAPPNYDAASNIGWASDLTTTSLWASGTGCLGSSSATPVGLASTNAAPRILASATSSCGLPGQPSCTPVVNTVPVTVQAGPTDCHVPHVKGLTLRKAKARLHRANCGASVRYVKRGRVGRVRYQPLAVGTGRPRGYRVKLVVPRRAHS